jgi:hypothetical protein
MQLVESCVVDAGANVRRTKEGYLTCMPRVARSGVQKYSPQEMNRPDIKRMISVFRPENEVFGAEAAKSYGHRPVTIDHPSDGFITSESWAKHAVGHTTSDVLRDGNYIRVPIMLLDQKAIEAFESGKNQLSCGYSCDVEWTPGVDPESGQSYDAIQRNLRMDHVAICSNARGGPELRIGDAPNVTAVTDINHTRNGEPWTPRTLHGVPVDRFGKPIGQAAEVSAGDDASHDSDLSTMVLNPQDALQQARDEYLANLSNAWMENKPRETRAQYQSFGDAVSERDRYIDEISNAWKQKPARLPDVRNGPVMPQPVADQPTGDAAEAAWKEYCEDLSNAWRRRA